MRRRMKLVQHMADSVARWIQEPGDRREIAGNVAQAAMGFASDTDVSLEAWSAITHRVAKLGLYCSDIDAASRAMACAWSTWVGRT